MNKNWLESIQLKNGTTLVSILGYLGDEDFYAMYDIILDLLHPDSPTYGVAPWASTALSARTGCWCA